MADWSKCQRLAVGTLVLIFVDITWVASSELTRYLFKGEHFNKPFFTTYLKTSMFTVYLLGFVFHRPWRNQCGSGPYSHRFMQLENYDDSDSETNTGPVMTNSFWVPVKFHDGNDKSSGTESDENGVVASGTPRVRFSQLTEVRHLADSQADDALLARLSYSATLQAQAAAHKLPATQVARISLTFCFLWFMGNFAYQQALSYTEAGIVNILSCSSGLFTLQLAALFPSGPGDRFTFSKLLMVLVSIAGVVMITISDKRQHLSSALPPGAAWSLLGALFYAVYIVFLRRKVEDETQIDFPMFFGFVGLWTVVLAWPGLAVLHYLGAEQFSWPTERQWWLLAANGLLGTVVSELMWVWGCFLTTSLMATLATSLTIPLSLLSDSLLYQVRYPPLLYAGTVPMFVAFFGLTLLSHWEDWDPAVALVRWLSRRCRRQTSKLQLRREDWEQTESLIAAESEMA